MDVDAAKFAVDAYTARNHDCHSKSQNLKIVEDWPRLGHQISQNLEELASILPYGEVQHYEKWQRIICYFRDRHIFLDEADTWKGRSAINFKANEMSDHLSRPIPDLTGLLTQVWQQAFIRSKLRDAPSSTVERRAQSWSDPTQSQSISRKRAASDPLDDEKPTEKQCLEMESEDTQRQKRMKEDHDACYMGLINDIEEFAGKDLGKSKALLQGCRDLHSKAREAKQGADSAAKAKEEKGVRRAAVKEAKLAAKAKGE